MINNFQSKLLFQVKQKFSSESIINEKEKEEEEEKSEINVNTI